MRACSSRAAAASGLGAGNQALGEGSAGANKPRQGDDSQAGGREMNDSDSSLKGDTVSSPCFSDSSALGRDGPYEARGRLFSVLSEISSSRGIAVFQAE